MLVRLSLDSGHALLRACMELGVTEGHAARLRSREGLPGAGGDQGALLLGERGKQVQHERINVRAKLCDQEGHLVRHEPADEMNIAAEPVQLRDGYVAPASLRRPRRP